MLSFAFITKTYIEKVSNFIHNMIGVAKDFLERQTKTYVYRFKYRYINVWIWKKFD